MKKYIPYIIITILLIIIAIGGTYIFMDYKNNQISQENSNTNNNNQPNNKEQENKEDEVLEDNVKLLSTRAKNDKIIQEYEVTLNGKIKTLELEFSYYKDDTFEVAEYIVTGTFNQNNIIYSNVIRDKYEEQDGEIKIIQTRNKEEIFNINIIKNNINENNFQIIKGEDNKSYLLLYPYTKEIDFPINPTVILLFNDELKLISENLISKNESPDYIVRNGFTDNEYTGNIPCEVEKSYNEFKYAKIENNKIYFLYPKLNRDDLSEGILEERIYTINNNKLNHKINNTYKITSICQKIE